MSLSDLEKVEQFEGQKLEVEEICINSSLNDDCLIKIFKYLPIKDRIKAELVCCNWNRVAKLSWSDEKKLSLDMILPYSSYDSRYSRDETFISKNINFLIKVVQRCGKYVEALTISPRFNRILLDEFLKKVSEYCKNINKLDFNFNCRNVNKDLNYLEQIFMHNKSISSIILYEVPFEGNCYRKLNVDTIKELSLKDCNINSNGSFYEFLSNIKNLNTFVILDQPAVIKESVNGLIINCRDLNKIRLKSSELSFFENLSSLLAKQQTLMDLKLCNVKIDQDLLNNLPNSIEVIEISYGYSSILDTSLFFKNLPNLSRLKIENVVISIEDSIQNHLTSLKELILIYGRNLNEMQHLNMTKFLSKIKKLQVLELENFSIDPILIRSELKYLNEIQISFDEMRFGDIPLKVSKFLKNQKCLQKLKLFNVFIDEKFIKTVNPDYLEELDINFIEDDIDIIDLWDGITKYIGHFYNLKTFKAHFEELKDIHLHRISECINRNIKKIDIKFNKYVPSTNQVLLFTRLQNLESLSLSGDYDESNIDKIFKNLAYCKNLKFFNINRCNFSTTGLISLVCLSNLRVLEIKHAENSDEDFLLFIGKSISLKELRFSSCKNITSDLITKASQIKVTREDTHKLKLSFDVHCSKFIFDESKHEPLIVVEYNYE